MKVTISKQKSIAYILTESDIRKIHSVMVAHDMQPRLKVECGSNVQLKPTDLEDLFSLTNADDRKITNLVFRSGFGAKEWDFELEFSFSRYFPVTYEIEATDDHATIVGHKIDHIINSTKQPYSALAVASFVTPMISALAFIGFAAFAAFEISGSHWTRATDAFCLYMLVMARHGFAS